MNWELIISIVSLVTGGSALTWIYASGKWKGEVETKLQTMRDDLGKITDGISGKVKSEVGHTSSDLNETVATEISGLRGEFTSALNRVHERLDEKSTSHQEVSGRLDVIVAGLQAQRQDWDTLRGDIRTLLRSEATTTNEIANFKERLSEFEKKVSAYAEKTVRLESDVAHINADRKK